MWATAMTTIRVAMEPCIATASAPICMVLLLGKNPAIADHLIAAAMERRLDSKVELVALEDEVELAANAYMAKRLDVPGA